MFSSLLSRISSSIPAPFLSISSTLQRNILSFLLKRTLGHLIKGGQLDLNQIESGIGAGRVELRGVELDPQAVKTHLPPSIPLTFNSGVIGTITIQLPFPNLWSGELSVTISGLEVQLSLKDQTYDASSEPSQDSEQDQEDETRFFQKKEKEVVEDITSSLIEAADRAISSNLEGQRLEASILSEAHSHTVNPDPFSEEEGNEQMEGHEETVGVISSIVNGLLSRLKVKVLNLKVKLSDREPDSETSSATSNASQRRIDEPIELELRIEEFNFGTETKTSTNQSSSNSSNPIEDLLNIQEIIRSVEISGIGLWMSTPTFNPKKIISRTKKPKVDSPTSDSPSSSRSGSNSANENYMEMSSGIQDLRDSRMGMSDDGESMYASAVGGDDDDDGSEDEEEVRDQAGSLDQDQDRHQSIEDETIQEKEPTELVMILSFGNESLKARLKTSKSNPQPRASSTSEEKDFGSGSFPNTDQVSTTQSPRTLSSTSTNLSIEIGTISILLETSHLCSLARLNDSLSTILASSNNPIASASAPSQPLRQVQESPIASSFSIKAIHLISIYDLSLSSSNPQLRHQSLRESVQNYFSRPINSHPQVGHIRLKIEGVSTRYSLSRKRKEMTVAIKNLGLFEHLSPRLISFHDSSTKSESKSNVPNIVPLLLFDGNLAQQEHETNSDLKNSKHQMESMDWRLGASSTSSSPYYKSNYGERGWKMRSKHSSRSQSSNDLKSNEAIDSSLGSVAIEIKIDLGNPAGSKVENSEIFLKPLHFFIDLSMGKRVLPLLKEIGQNLKVVNHQDGTSTPRRKSGMEMNQSVDLASSIATIQGAEKRSNRKTSESKQSSGPTTSIDGTRSDSPIQIKCPLVRLEIRVPSSPSRKSSSTSTTASSKARILSHLGLDLRAGILVLDLRSLEASSGARMIQSKPPIGVRFGESGSAGKDSLEGKGSSAATVGLVTLFLKPPQANKATSFAIIGKIKSSPHSQSGSAHHGFQGEVCALSPKVAFQTLKSSSASTSSTQTVISLPSVQVGLSKPVLDSIFLLADDLSLWSSGLEQVSHLFEDEDGNLMEELDQDYNGEEDDGGLEPLKILGSRFFGVKMGASIFSADSDQTEMDQKSSSSPPSISLSISECAIVLELGALVKPEVASGVRIKGKGKFEEGQEKENETNDNSSRTLEVNGKELNLQVGASKKESSSNVLDFSVLSLLVQENSRKGKRDVFSRTTQPSLTKSVSPMLSVQFASLSDVDTSYRESKIEVDFRSFTLSLTEDFSLVKDLQTFLKSPEGVFENVEPNEVTRISLKIKDSSIFLTPPTVPSRAALVIGRMLLRVKLMPESPKTSIHYACADVALFLIDKKEPAKSSRKVSRSAQEHWSSLGFARLLVLDESKGSITLSSLTRPELDVKVSRAGLRLMACADTLLAAGELAKDFSEASDISKARDRANSDSSVSDLQDSSISSRLAGSDPMLISIEENAFRRPSSLSSSGADLMEDDIPTNLAFLGNPTDAEVPAHLIETPLDSSEFFGDSESVASLSTAPPSSGTGNIMMSTESVIVRLLDPAGIRPKSSYFSDPDHRPQSIDAFTSSSSNLRVRITNCDVTLGLFGGYDWASTRQAIEEEARKVRRRLQKIKQLVAEGQTPDDSVEEATAALFESIHISLPSDAMDMEAGAVMRAMDDELDGDQSETASSASTWQQPLPTARSSAASSGERRKKIKLQRSGGSMLDIELKGVEVEFDAFNQLHSLSSRVGFSASTLEILDNLKTSTWRTFLTAMPPEGSAYRRDADAKMVKMEVREIRPEKGKSRLETRMRAKIEPLRLHVDQDALDFLKKFFAFKTPGAATPIPSASAKATGPFIQHAEIFPVRLKLDYKPKRVNYNLLREGQTIELMNFFHFDGAEMTLRHVTLRGITGWPRLFDTLNDIWTPDIKANQLADVLSGVAPIRSLVNVGAGVADLILLPIEQYQKDGRLLRGVQKGANSFAKNTMLEAVKLGARLATGTQVVLEKADHVLGGRINDPVQGEAIAGPSSPAGESSSRSARRVSGVDESEDLPLDDQALQKVISKYADQPEDMREALTQAYKGLSKGLSSAAQTILAVPMEVYERGGGEGGAHPVIRAVPIAVLRGAMGASEAVSKTLMGVQNSLDPKAQSANAGKYKHRER